MDKILVKSKYNPIYHKGFYRLHMFHKSASLYFFALAAILSFYLAIQNTISSNATSSEIIFSWGFAILLLVALPIMTFGKVSSIVRNTKRERQETLEIIEITKAKITRFLEGNKEKVVLGWENFESVYEVENCFYLYIDKERGLVVPKEDIVEGNIEMFRKLIINNIKKDKKGKPKYKKMYKEQTND